MSRRAPHSPGYEGNKVVSAVDWRGNTFRVGDQVIYCIGAGRGQMMAVGTVLQIKVDRLFRTDAVTTDSDDPDAYTQPWFKPGRYLKDIRIPYDDVKVQVRTLKTSGRWDNQERSKPAWVNPMNITATGPVSVP